MRMRTRLARSARRKPVRYGTACSVDSLSVSSVSLRRLGWQVCRRDTPHFVLPCIKKNRTHPQCDEDELYQCCDTDYCTSHWLLISGNDTKRVSKSSLVSFRALEGTWRPMNSTLTAVLSVGNTQHAHPCVTKKTRTASSLTPAFFSCNVPFSMATPSEQVSTV